MVFRVSREKRLEARELGREAGRDRGREVVGKLGNGKKQELT